MKKKRAVMKINAGLLFSAQKDIWFSQKKDPGT